MAEATSPNDHPPEPRFALIPDTNNIGPTDQTVLRAPAISHPDLWISPTSQPIMTDSIPHINMGVVDQRVDEAGQMQSATNPKPKSKKKGTASVVKKAPKKGKSRGGKSTTKSKKDASTAAGADAQVDGATTEEESDNGPYCICRGPDDHRWMICCEACEDWFHGECVKLDKEIGETLIEKFICPNCTDGRTYATRYKKTCSLPGCNKPARIYNAKEQSVFCSDEHVNAWWDQMISSLPAKNGKRPRQTNDSLTREEFMALLSSNFGGVEEKTGTWKLAKHPFVREDGLKRQYTDAPSHLMTDGDIPVDHLTEEEKMFLHASARDRFMLGEEILQCKKMIQLLDWAQARLKAAISASRLSHDACGYDSCLDSVGVQAAFRAFAESPAGKKVFADQKLGDATGVEGEDSTAGGMCEKKRCKPHAGWYHLFIRSTKIQIQELTAIAQEKLDQEKVFKEAAEERYYRKKAENNYVEVMESGDEEDEKPSVDLEKAAEPVEPVPVPVGK